jgi:small-conductance mechanosensitive channel
VKLLEKECDSLSVKMSEMFEKNAEKAHLNERIRQAERAAMVSARETKRVVEENRESHHVIREQNKRISKLEKRLEEQVKKLEVSKKANELMRAGRKNNNIDAKPKTSPTKQLAPEEIDWEAAYKEIDELREAKRTNAR